MRDVWPRKPFAWFTTLLVTGVVLFGAAPPTADAVDQFNPAVVNLTLGAGESAKVAKVLHLDAQPEFADIIIAIDTTGSMGGAIAQAKTEAIQICNAVKMAIPGARFAVVDFKDYDRTLVIGSPSSTAYGGPGDYPYLPRTVGFVADCMTFAAAINTMSASGGGDFAEAYNRVFFEAFSDPVLVADRNPQAVQFLVVLGDAPPHDPVQNMTGFPSCGSQPPVDPGRDMIVGDADDLHTVQTIAGLSANNITLLMIRYNNSIPLACYKELAGPTGGEAVNAGSGPSLSAEIVSLVMARAAQINRVDLEVSPLCPLGISFSPAPPYGPFTAPVDIPFTETITAPTLAGDYACTVTAVVDGARRAVQLINVTVTAGPPARLDLEPKAATNPVDTEHCVTATVTDAFGNPVKGVVVVFSVTPSIGRSPSSGSVTTNASGQATFCYTSALLGPDVIHAFADTSRNGTQDAGEPSDNAAKVWTPPVSTALCTVDITYGGFIHTDKGDRATFGGNAKVNAAGEPMGQEEYQDQGPAEPMNVHSINVLAVTCTTPSMGPKEAAIHGEATIDGSGSFVYRIDVKDVNEPGKGFDTYRIRLSKPYDSGEHVLEGGNIQIHK